MFTADLGRSDERFGGADGPSELAQIRAGGPGLCVQLQDFARAAAGGEVPSSARLRAGGVHCLAALEAASPKSVSRQGRAPPESCGEGSALASLQLPGLGGNLGRSSARRLVTPILPLSYTSLSLSKFSLFIRIRTHRKHLILT